ncbi:hypothetical protein AGATL06_24960 [Agathobaculum sp. TL06]
MTAAWFPQKNRGLTSGLVGAGLTLGTGFGGYYANLLWDWYGQWRDCIVRGGILWLIFIVLYLVFAKDAPRGLYPEDTAAEQVFYETPRVNVWTLPGAWLCTMALFCVCWMACGFQTTLPSYMTELGYTTDQSGAALLWNGLIGLIMTPVGGALSDTFIRRGVSPLKARAYCMAFVGFLFTAVSLFIFPFVAGISFSLVMVISLLHGLGAPVSNASIGALPLDLLGDPVLADKMFGMTCLLGLSGGIIAPLIVTAAVEAYGWTAGIFITALGAVAGVIIGIIMPKFKRDR